MEFGVRNYAALVALTAGMLVPSLPAAASTSSGADGTLEGCKPYQVKQTYSVDSHGHRLRTGTRTSSTVREFGGKATMKVTVPPPGFDPHTASDSELHHYGFPPQPKSPSARRQWDLMYPKKNIHYVVPEMCQARSGLTHRPLRASLAQRLSPLVGLTRATSGQEGSPGRQPEIQASLSPTSDGPSRPS
jgi:hypothetical protein